MGRQSYVLPFKTEAELERIKQVIAMHNDLDGESPAGEALGGFCVAKHRSENEFAILCHHGPTSCRILRRRKARLQGWRGP